MPNPRCHFVSQTSTRVLDEVEARLEVALVPVVGIGDVEAPVGRRTEAAEQNQTFGRDHSGGEC